jgi:hypothetical protein
MRSELGIDGEVVPGHLRVIPFEAAHVSALRNQGGAVNRALVAPLLQNPGHIAELMAGPSIALIDGADGVIACAGFLDLGEVVFAWLLPDETRLRRHLIGVHRMLGHYLSRARFPTVVPISKTLIPSWHRWARLLGFRLVSDEESDFDLYRKNPTEAVSWLTQ